ASCTRLRRKDVDARHKAGHDGEPCIAVLASLVVAVGLYLISSAAALAQTPESATTTGPVVGAAALPRDLSPWGMFTSADIVVKAVIIGLALASVLTWTVWLAQTLGVVGAQRPRRAALYPLP